MKPKLAFPIPVTPEFNPGDLPENITKFLDLRYACDSGEQVLDLYLPEEKDRREGKKFPLILYIHEGAFAFGSKRDKRAETLFEALKRGYAIASVDYRKSGEVTWPAPLYDIKTAVRFLRAHAERYALDEKKFAVWGMSAGAYYGSMAAVTNGLPGFEDPETGFGRFDSSIQAAVDLCGTDEMGRDIFSRLLYGGRASLSLGFLATIISTIIGMFIGSVVGYFGGVVDTVVMRFVDILQAIPGILLAIAISACLGSGFVNTIIALSIGGIPMTVRLLRGSIMGVRKMEYLEAAQTINCSVPRLIIKHILPNSISPIIVSVTMGIGNTILMAASLSYIGLGVQPPTPEWGAMLSAARTYMRDYPHMVLFPGLAIAIVVLSLNMLGDGLRDALDPKLKQ